MSFCLSLHYYIPVTGSVLVLWVSVKMVLSPVWEWTLTTCLALSLRFLRLWIAVLVIYPTNQAVIALTFSNYILQPLYPSCLPPESGLRLLAAVCLRELQNKTEDYITTLSFISLLDFLFIKQESSDSTLMWYLCFAVLSVVDMGELLQRALGHMCARCLHCWQAFGPGSHHNDGCYPNMQRFIFLFCN